MSEIVIPFVQSTFARLNLNIAPGASLPEARRLQTNLVAELKGAGLKSEIEGSVGADIWALPHRTTEKRNRIKAIVSTKDFCMSHSKGLSHSPLWNLIGEDVCTLAGTKLWHMLRMILPLLPVTSFYHCDKRGSHTGWLIKVPELALALNKNPKDVHELWYQFLENGGGNPAPQPIPFLYNQPAPAASGEARPPERPLQSVQ